VEGTKSKSWVLLIPLVIFLSGFLVYKFFLGGFSTLKQSVLNQKVSDTATLGPSLSPDITKSSDETAIALTIDSPENNSTVSSSEVTVSGKTVVSAEVSVNDKDIKVDQDGNYSVKITLDEGENTITVVANDENGSYAEGEVTVNLNTE
jgi:hypothetical protein